MNIWNERTTIRKFENSSTAYEQDFNSRVAFWQFFLKRLFSLLSSRMTTVSKNFRNWKFYRNLDRKRAGYDHFDRAGNCLGIWRSRPKNDGTVYAQEQKKTRTSRTNSDPYQLNLIIYTKSLKNSPEYHRCSLVLQNYLHMLNW